MRFGFVDHGVVKMQSQLGVDIEGEIQHSGAFIDGHDGAVLAENIDLLIIGVTRLNLIDVCDGKSGIGVDNTSVQEALEFQLCAHKQPIQVIHFIREQETAGTVACCVAVLDQVEALQGKGFVKILEKDIVGMSQRDRSTDSFTVGINDETDCLTGRRGLTRYSIVITAGF